MLSQLSLALTLTLSLTLALALALALTLALTLTRTLALTRWSAGAARRSELLAKPPAAPLHLVHLVRHVC